MTSLLTWDVRPKQRAFNRYSLKPVGEGMYAVLRDGQPIVWSDGTRGHDLPFAYAYNCLRFYEQTDKQTVNFYVQGHMIHHIL